MTLSIFIYVLLLASFLCLFRIGKGPTAPDRIVAIDILGILVVGFCGFLSVQTGRDFYMNVALSWALLSFIGTLALAKYLEGKGFERLVGEGDRVSAGDPVIRADLDYIAALAKDTVTPIIISDESDVKSIEKKLHIVKCGDVVMEVK